MVDEDFVEYIRLISKIQKILDKEDGGQEDGNEDSNKTV